MLRLGSDLCIESLSGGLVSAFVEVAVDVEDGPYRGVAEAVGDDLGMLSLGDEERHLGASERVGTEILVEARCGEGRFPYSARPAGSADGTSLGCWEQPDFQSLLIELGDVVDEPVGDRSGETHGSVALGRLGWSDDHPALNVRCCPTDTDQAAQRVEVTELQTGEFTDAEPAEGSGWRRTMATTPSHQG